MVKDFKKISVEEDVHEFLKKDKKKLKLKSLSAVIRLYKYGQKQ